MALFPCRPESGGVPYMIWELSTRMYLCSICTYFSVEQAFLVLLSDVGNIYYWCIIFVMPYQYDDNIIESCYWDSMILVYDKSLIWQKIALSSGLSLATLCTNSFKISLGYYYKSAHCETPLLSLLLF